MFVPAIGLARLALMSDATGGGVFYMRRSPAFHGDDSDEHYWLAPVVFQFYYDLPKWLRVGAFVGCRYFAPDLWCDHGDVIWLDGVRSYWHRGVGESCETCAYSRRVVYHYDHAVNFMSWLDTVLGMLK